MSEASSSQIGDYHHPGPEMLMSATQKEVPWQSRPRQRAQLSCDRCRKLKRKCDRQYPCTECASFASACTYQRAKETTEALNVSRERRKYSRRRNGIKDTSLPSLKSKTTPYKSIARSSSGQDEQQHRLSAGPEHHKSCGMPFLLNDKSPVEASNSSSSSNLADSSPWHLTPPSSHTSTTTPESKLTPGSKSDSNPALIGQEVQSSAMHAPPQKSIRSSSVPQDITKLVREQNFLTRVMSIWFRDIDWMLSLIRGSEFEKIMTSDLDFINSDAHMKRFGGLIYAMVGLCALMFPTDVEGCLVCMVSDTERHGFYTASSVRLAAFAKTDQWLDELARESASVSTWNGEVFQTALLHGMHIKYTGNWNLYREVSSRDMDRVQRAGYHNLSEMVANGLSDDEIVARNAVFWRFFCHDRISSLFDGVPYTIQARNADMWLFEAGDEPVHIKYLCRDSGAGALPDRTSNERPPVSAELARKLEGILSPYTVAMTKLAALAGRCSDRLNSMSKASLTDNYVRAEHIAAETDDDLFDLESKIDMKQLSVSEIPMVTLTIARIRRDITTRLSRHIARLHKAAPQGEEAMVQTLNRRCLNTAKSLIRQSTGVLGSTPIRVIAMPFFTLFVAETMVELLTSVEKAANSSNVRGALDSEAKDDLKHALIGRNFLVLLSRVGEIQLNAMVTQKACVHISAVLHTCLPDHHAVLHRQVMDITSVFDPEPVINAIPSPPQALDNGIAPQKAEDVLNFLGSLTSLQRIFEMGGQSWSQ